MNSRLKSVSFASAAAVVLSLALVVSASASDNKIALIPGGPHPYFAPWEQAAADAKKDFGIAAVDFKVPTDWKLNLQTELIESLVAQGYNGFGIFPGDAVGINSTVSELKGSNIPAAALAGCAADPTDMSFCLGTDVFNSAYLGTKELIKAMGGKGKIVHLAGLLVDPNTTLRENAVREGSRRDERRGDPAPDGRRHRRTGSRRPEDQRAPRRAEGRDRWNDRHRLHPVGGGLEVASDAR